MLIGFETTTTTKLITRSQFDAQSSKSNQILTLNLIGKLIRNGSISTVWASSDFIERQRSTIHSHFNISTNNINNNNNVNLNAFNLNNNNNNNIVDGLSNEYYHDYNLNNINMNNINLFNNFSSKYIFYTNNSWPILLLFVFVLFGLVGNMLVCLAIKIDPRLQNATNYYLFSLATTDLLVSVLVIPLAIVKNFFKYWILGDLMCTLWIFLDVFLCTTSILLLCVISCERYIGIKNPLKNRDRSKSKTKLIIILIWFLSILLSSPILVLGYVDTRNVLKNGQCSLYNNHFIIYGSIFSFIIPLFIMITMYSLTVKRLLSVLKEFKSKDKSTSKSTSKEESAEPIDPSTAVKSSANNKASLNRLLGKLKDSAEATPNATATANTTSLRRCVSKDVDPTVRKSLLNDLFSNGVRRSFGRFQKSSFASMRTCSTNTGNTLRMSTGLNGESSAGGGDSSANGGPALPGAGANKFRSLVNKHRLINRAVYAFQTNRESNKVKNEKKAVKVLGIVFVIFVIAWGPFAIMNILSAFCDLSGKCHVYPSILNILTWLGYISSSINPLVYNAFNEKFRFAFKKILKCDFESLKKQSMNRDEKLLLVKLTAQNMSRWSGMHSISQNGLSGNQSGNPTNGLNTNNGGSNSMYTIKNSFLNVQSSRRHMSNSNSMSKSNSLTKHN